MRRICVSLGILLAGAPALANFAQQQAANAALQNDIYFHHILPGQQRAAAEASAAAAAHEQLERQRRVAGVYDVVGQY